MSFLIRHRTSNQQPDANPADSDNQSCSSPSTVTKPSRKLFDHVSTIMHRPKFVKSEKRVSSSMTFYRRRGKGIGNTPRAGKRRSGIVNPGWGNGSDSDGYESSIRAPSDLGDPALTMASDDDLPVPRPTSSLSYLKRASVISSALSSSALSTITAEDEEGRTDSQRRRRTRCISSPPDVLLSMFPLPPNWNQDAVAAGRQLGSKASAQSSSSTSDAVRSNTADAPPEEPPVRRTIPISLLSNVLVHLPQSTLSSVALVSQSFLREARKSLYRSLDLSSLSQMRVRNCLKVLRRERDIADLVQTFITAEDMEIKTLSGALKNMTRMTSLTINIWTAQLSKLLNDSYDFRLASLTIRATSVSPEELGAVLTFLSNQPTVVSLCLPNLQFDSNGDALPTPSPSLLPALTTLTTPYTLLPLFAQGRSLISLTLKVHSTLYDGLRPSALMSSVVEGAPNLKKLEIVFGTGEGLKIDKRTIERTLSAAANECKKIEELGITWTGAGGQRESLYKYVSSALPKLTSLRALRLNDPACGPSARRPRVQSWMSLPVPDLSPSFLRPGGNMSQGLRPVSQALSLPPMPNSPCSPMRPTSPSPSLLPMSPTSLLSARNSALVEEKESEGREEQCIAFPTFSPSPTSPLLLPPSPALTAVGEGPRNDVDANDSAVAAAEIYGKERTLLGAWSKSCQTLESVIFVSGAEWSRSAPTPGGESVAAKTPMLRRSLRARTGRWTYVGLTDRTA